MIATSLATAANVEVRAGADEERLLNNTPPPCVFRELTLPAHTGQEARNRPASDFDAPELNAFANAVAISLRRSCTQRHHAVVPTLGEDAGVVSLAPTGMAQSVALLMLAATQRRPAAGQKARAVMRLRATHLAPSTGP